MQQLTLPVAAILAILAAPTAAQTIAEKCTTRCLPGGDRIVLRDIGKGQCGIDLNEKGQIDTAEVFRGEWTGWTICSTCPYEATVQLDRWSTKLRDIVVVWPPNTEDAFTRVIPKCGQEYVSAQVKGDAVLGSHDFKLSVTTGLQKVDYDPQLQIRERERMVTVGTSALVSAIVGLAGLALGFYVARRRT